MDDKLGPRYDFHTHTIHSDGELTPAELVRRAFIKGLKTVALTDHADSTNLENLVNNLQRIKDNITWDIHVLTGIELTHVPQQSIAKLAREAKILGADIVVVHGETLVEPVEPGTNHAAVTCPEVDVLAHPGILAAEDAQLAAKNNVFLELSTRRGHCLGNGLVAKLALEADAKLVVNTDTHAPGDMVDQTFAYKTALAAGLSDKQARQVVCENPKLLLKKLG